MITFKIQNDDLVFDGQNNLVMVEGKEEEAQSIERILTTNINEWFLNIYHGLDYDKIQGKGKTKEGIRLAITEAVFQDERVENIDYMDIDINNTQRNLDVKFQISMKSGEVITGNEVIGFG